MMSHMFRAGQMVRLIRGYPRRDEAYGFYEITRRLPYSEGEFHYRIKSTREPHERVAGESELEAA